MKYCKTMILGSLLAIIGVNARQPLSVDGSRLERTILHLATFGQKANGETSRVAFSDADIAGRAYVMDIMKDAGLEVHIDFAGNIIGLKPGSQEGKTPIAFGSHIDMVPDGGNYDGCVGALAAIEVVRTLGELGIRHSHPLQVIIFSNEEGGVMGSRALAGQLGPDALDVKNSTGFSMREGIDRIGGDAGRIAEVARKPGELTAFLELHVEQGGILDRTDTDIGVVEGIVGIKWWDVVITGFANHAGTTPMDARQDALLAAARFIVAVNEVTTGYSGNQVGTVGRITAAPGAPNVIPGEVLLSLEIRDLSSDKIEAIFNDIEVRAREIATVSGTTFRFEPIDATGAPAMTDPRLQELIAESAEALGLSHQKMQSGAGHDAQEMAMIAPTGMIFVPSKAGISHSPKEFTSAGEMAHGANVLLNSILAIDRTWD